MKQWKPRQNKPGRRNDCKLLFYYANDSWLPRIITCKQKKKKEKNLILFDSLTYHYRPQVARPGHFPKISSIKSYRYETGNSWELLCKVYRKPENRLKIDASKFFDTTTKCCHPSSWMSEMKAPPCGSHQGICMSWCSSQSQLQEEAMKEEHFAESLHLPSDLMADPKL